MPWTWIVLLSAALLGLAAGVAEIASTSGDDRREGDRAGPRAARAAPDVRPAAASDRNCRLDLESLRAAGCEVLFSDDGEVQNPGRLWGMPDCASADRHAQIPSGGDSHVPAAGSAPASLAFRRLSVLDGDQVWGERCELGRNDRRSENSLLYEEGQRRITFASLRLTESWPLADSRWQTVLQMKQTNPADGGGGGPMLELQARAGRWLLVGDWEGLWGAPAEPGTWTRFAFDVTYSSDPDQGAITVFVDLNGDGDAADPGERSPRFNRRTLKAEIADSGAGAPDTDGIALGESIASHLRIGVYHDEQIACSPPEGCSVDVDNVQIVAP